MSEEPGGRTAGGEGSTLGWALVGAQFVLLGVLGLEVLRARRPLGLPGLLGIAVIAAGSAVVALASQRLGRRLRAHPAPPEDAVLRTEGVYGVVRHPIYLGLLLIALGMTLIARSPSAASAAGALCALLHVKANLEERLLAAHFPGYPAYTVRVPRIIPGL